MLTGPVHAPDLTVCQEWVNTPHPVSLKQLRGKIVLLDFWTFGCINCQHIVPDLLRLEAAFAPHLVVIGVHSGKFTHEKSLDALKRAVLRMGIQHPVVNDPDFVLWDQYGVRAWPTIVLIDPLGKVIGQRSGEGFADLVEVHIRQLIKQHSKILKSEPFRYMYDTDAGNTLFAPTKLVSGPRDTLFVADTGHHRILQIDANGTVLAQIGNGRAGLSDGEYQSAQFRSPRGLAVWNRYLFVADTGNHRIARVDLHAGVVENIAGNGTQGRMPFGKDWEKPVLPNSPWDLAVGNYQLYIANAGTHQLLRMDLPQGALYPFAGSSREALFDGRLPKAAFCQPQGLVFEHDFLFVADAEASALRQIDIHQQQVRTLIGKGLFVFGDQDGRWEEARLQHVAGLSIVGGKLYLTDQYNGKLKAVSLQDRQITTIADGLSEPDGLAFFAGEWWVVETGKHRLVAVSAKGARPIALQ